MAPSSGYLQQRARENGCDYLIPEHVQDAVNAGVPLVALWGELLAIIGKQRGVGVEDHALCCFVALQYEAERASVDSEDAR